MFFVRHIPSIRVAVLCLLSTLILVAGLGAQHHLACAASRVSQEKNWQIAAMLDPESGGASGLAVRALEPDVHTSGPFHGVKANTGTVTHTKDGNKNVLTLSDDFKPPETPDPHWQVVDSQGTVYLLDRLQAKNGKYNKSITLPAYVPDVAKVQIWCAFAETNLGEASFDEPVK